MTESPSALPCLHRGDSCRRRSVRVTFQNVLTLDEALNFAYDQGAADQVDE